jgi:hypothetical protein
VKMISRVLMAALAAIFICGGTVAHATTLYGTVNNPDGSPFNGVIYLTLSQAATVSTTGTCGGPIYVSNSYKVGVQVVAGSIVSSPAIYDSNCFNVAGFIPYSVQLISSTGGVVQQTWIVTSTPLQTGSENVGTLIPLTSSGVVFQLPIAFNINSLMFGTTSIPLSSTAPGGSTNYLCAVSGQIAGCAGGGSGSMTWPSGGAGVPNYNGSSAYGTTYNASNQIPANFLNLTAYLTSAVAASTYEPQLGNPSTSGYVLSSTTGGARSWIAPGAGGGALPSATAAGQALLANGAGTTYTASNISKVPVELEGATPYTTEAAAEAGADDTAHFQSAVTAAVNGVATCQAGRWYHVEGPVNFSSNEGLIGTSNQTYGGLCNLVTNSASTKVLSAVGTSGAYLAGITIANILIDRSTAGTGTSAGIYVSFVGGMIVTNTLSNDSIYDYYRHAAPGYGIGYWSHNQAGWLLSETSGTYYGFYDDSADGNAMNSILTLHSAVACQNLGSSTVSYGQYVTGIAVNDNDTDDFNTAGCTHGQAVNFTGSGGGFSCSDIHWWNSTHDDFILDAEKVSGCTAAQTGSVEISGGWAVGGPKTVSTTGAVYILNSSGVSVNHQQIGAHAQGGSYPSQYGVNISGGSGNSAVGNTCLNQTSCALLTNSTFGNTVTGNTVINGTASAKTIAFQINNGSTYNNVSNNTVSSISGGTWTSGLTIASGANNNTYVGNTCDSTVTTCVSDSGTGNGLQGPVAVNGAMNVKGQVTSTTGTFVSAQAASYSVYDMDNALISNTASFEMGTGYIGETTFGVATKLFWYDNTNSGMRMALDNAGNFCVGYATPYPTTFPAKFCVGTTGQFQVNGAGAVTAPSFNATTSVTTPLLTVNGPDNSTSLTPATSSINYNSPAKQFVGNYWNGSATATDTWTCFNNLGVWSGSNTNPESYLDCNHSGSSGGGTFRTNSITTANLNAGLISAYADGTQVWLAAAHSLATSSANYSSGLMVYSGDYWNGSSNAADEYTINNVMPAGTNPQTVLTIAHASGSSGGGSVSFGSLPVSMGALTAPSINGLTPPTPAGNANFTQTIDVNTATMEGGTAILPGTCYATDVTIASASVLTTDIITIGWQGKTTGVTGYVPGASLTINPYPTAGYVNFSLCNYTASSITPTAITINWRVQR